MENETSNIAVEQPFSVPIDFYEAPRWEGLRRRLEANAMAGKHPATIEEWVAEKNKEAKKAGGKFELPEPPAMAKVRIAKIENFRPGKRNKKPLATTEECVSRLDRVIQEVEAIATARLPEKAKSSETQAKLRGAELFFAGVKLRMGIKNADLDEDLGDKIKGMSPEQLKQFLEMTAKKEIGVE